MSYYPMVQGHYVTVKTKTELVFSGLVVRENQAALIIESSNPDIYGAHGHVMIPWANVDYVAPNFVNSGMQ